MKYLKIREKSKIILDRNLDHKINSFKSSFFDLSLKNYI